MAEKQMKKLLKKAENIKLIAMDIDGVLTGGEIIILDDGQEIKFWNVKDRIAFHFAKKYCPDLKFAWITGRKSLQVAKRAAEIGIDDLFQDIMDKETALTQLCSKYGIQEFNVAYLGDDLIDIPVLKKSGLSICPADAVCEVKGIVDFVSDHNGGRGVLRQAVEIVLKSKGVWQRITREFLRSSIKDKKDN